jgi:hypothetical protein
MSLTDNTKKPLGSSYASPNGFLAGEKWKGKAKPRARSFCVTHGLSIGRSVTLSPVSCQRLLPKKGHNTALGDTKRINILHTPTRVSTPPRGKLRRRDSHMYPFLLFSAGVIALLRAAATMIAHLFFVCQPDLVWHRAISFSLFHRATPSPKDSSFPPFQKMVKPLPTPPQGDYDKRC